MADKAMTGVVVEAGVVGSVSVGMASADRKKKVKARCITLLE